MNPVDHTSSAPTFAVMFGNRSFFPASLIHSARIDLQRVLKEEGYGMLMMDENATREGAVETAEEAKKFASFLHQHKGEFQGVILSLPNFGDEGGASLALKDAGVPILIQAYPDELDKMGPKDRRDSFCGKLSIMDVFKQYGIKFTNLAPHTVHPLSAAFRANLTEFAAICNVVTGMSKLVVGAVGARTTAFKTVRYDEIAMQKVGITVETLDLADIFQRVDAVDPASAVFKAKMARLVRISDWKDAPEEALVNVTRLGLIMDEIIAEFGMGAMAIRCWTELQKRYGISPCLLTGDLADRGVPVACEVDVANAVTMFALGTASGEATSILDWNNNYGDDLNKCILFHCGNVPESLMAKKGYISDHPILATSIGTGRGFGCNQGRIRPMDFTYGSMITIDGRLEFYLGTARMTGDTIPNGFFGCAGVAEFKDLQGVLRFIGKHGHRHHVSLTPGDHINALREAFENYLGYGVTVL